MTDCCTGDIIDLGCIFSCDLVVTGEVADADGVYTLEAQPDGVKLVSNTITAGNSIVFAGGYLNEDGVTVFKVLKPNGDYLSVAGSNCFRLQVKPTNTPTLVNVECPPSELCDVIETATAQQIVDCLSDAQETAIEALICEGAGCETDYEFYVGGVLRGSGNIDCSVNNTINIYLS